MPKIDSPANQMQFDFRLEFLVMLNLYHENVNLNSNVEDFKKSEFQHWHCFLQSGNQRCVHSIV